MAHGCDFSAMPAFGQAELNKIRGVPLRACVLMMLFSSLAMRAAVAQEPQVTIPEILDHCYYKPLGADRKFDLELTVQDADGTTRTEERYVGWWKDYRGDGDLVSKLILFRRAPLYRQDDTYLRWDYTTSSGKPPEQWAYSMRQQRVRRVAQRDPNRPALGLIAEDLVQRQLDQDTHTLRDVELREGSIVYTLESIPRTDDSTYKKIISQFERHGEWPTCTLVRQEFITSNGKQAKQMDYTWQQVGNAWAWHVVTVRNAKPRSITQYRLRNLQVNVGLTDDNFSKRRLTRTFVDDDEQQRGG